MHHPIFWSPTLNRIHQVFLSTLYGHPVSTYVSGHNFSHHQNTQTQKDIIRTSKLRFRWHFLNQLLFFFWVIPALMRGEKDFKLKMREVLPEWYRQYKIEMAFAWATKIVLAWIDWKAFLLYVALPQLYCVWGIIGMNLIQHDGCDPGHTYNHSRSVTGRFINWLTFNNGYHGAHHMKPGLHWSKYPEYHRLEIAPFLHPELEHRSLFKYLFKTYLFPGRRVRFDGGPLNLQPAGLDADWIPSREILAQTSASFGAVSYGRGHQTR